MIIKKIIQTTGLLDALGSKGGKEYNNLNVDVKGFSEKAFREETSKLVSKANKRLQRLEKGGYKNSPAYQKWLNENGEKFSIRGKTFNQVQAERAKLRNFLESQTSTIRGINKNLKDIANSTGLKYKNLKDLQNKADKFFELSSKVEQYLRQVDDMASAIGYQKIWQAINQYVKDSKVDLSKAGDDIDEITGAVTQLIREQQKTYLTNKKDDDDWLLMV